MDGPKRKLAQAGSPHPFLLALISNSGMLKDEPRAGELGSRLLPPTCISGKCRHRDFLRPVSFSFGDACLFLSPSSPTFLPPKVPGTIWATLVQFKMHIIR